MPTIDNNRRLAVLVKHVLSLTLHLFVDTRERRMVSFACEQAPFMTFQSHSLPARCPVCGSQNPFKGEARDHKQGSQRQHHRLAGNLDEIVDVSVNGKINTTRDRTTGKVKSKNKKKVGPRG